MKHLNQVRLSLFLFLVLILSSSIYAGEHDNLIPEIIKSEISAIRSSNMFNDFSAFSEAKLSVIEENLIRGVKSDNSGLQTSCAYFLGEMKSSKAMIPLLKLVKHGATDESRIIAALSLYKIHSKIGMCQLKGLAKTEKSELVRKVFDRIYKKYTCDNCTFEEL
ncbi:MAG: hypothetical protein WCE54_07480 [Ignavibacteriaceae bacterium]